MELNMTIGNVALIPMIVGVVEAVKIALPFEMTKRLAPLFSLVLGAFLFVGLKGYSFENAVLGVVLGLSAMGLYSGTKSTGRVIRGEK